MLTLTLQFLLAHILGDFIFQPTKWVKDKEEYKIKSKYMYAHLGVHLAVLFVTIKFNSEYVLGAIFIAISHYLIDLTKLYLQTKKNKRLWFCIDQVTHLSVIALVVYYYHPYTVPLDKVYSNTTLLFIIALLMCTQVVSIVIKALLFKWQNKLYDKKGVIEQKSLPQAGSYIGMLERLFVFGFIVLNQWSGIGFLLAAKSIFRFGDLTKASDRKLTEYILVGTLLSFGFAIVIAKVYLYLIVII